MKKNLLRILGILILIIILSKIDIHLVWGRIRSCNVFLLLIAVLVEIGCLLIKAMRWQLILDIFKIKVKYWDCLRAYWSAVYLAAITPGKVGDISRVWFLGKNNTSLSSSVFSVILDRMIDIITLILIGLVVIFFYIKELSKLNNLLVPLFIILSFCVWVIFFRRRPLNAWLKNILYKIFSNKDKISLKDPLDLQTSKESKITTYFLISIYILIGWLVYFLGWWILAKALFLKMPIFYSIAALSIATIVSLIPISISGLGTRDATLIFIFSKIGITKSSSLSFSLLIFAIEIFIACLGIIFFLQSKEDNLKLQ